MVRAAVLSASDRLQRVALAFVILAAGQMVVASCTPEPAPYAVRVAISR